MGYAHRIEKADLHAHEEMLLITNLVDQLKIFMKGNKDYSQRTQIEKKCIEMGVVFRAFALYSTTQFVEYHHRTYKVFIHMTCMVFFTGKNLIKIIYQGNRYCVHTICINTV